MILRTYYKNAQALVNVPSGSLVFDGVEFVDPAKAKYIALIYTTAVDANVKYQIAPGQSLSQVLSFQNQLLCRVIRVESDTDQLPTDVVTVPAPADGMCVCGVTCFGTQVQQVPIYQD